MAVLLGMYLPILLFSFFATAYIYHVQLQYWVTVLNFQWSGSKVNKLIFSSTVLHLKLYYETTKFRYVCFLNSQILVIEHRGFVQRLL